MSCLNHADLPRLENPETGVRHAAQDANLDRMPDGGWTTICGVQNEDFELSLDGEWSDYDDGSLCGRCTRRVSAGLRALLDEALR